MVNILVLLVDVTRMVYDESTLRGVQVQNVVFIIFVFVFCGVIPLPPGSKHRCEYREQPAPEQPPVHPAANLDWKVVVADDPPNRAAAAENQAEHPADSFSAAAIFMQPLLLHKAAEGNSEQDAADAGAVGEIGSWASESEAEDNDTVDERDHVDKYGRDDDAALQHSK